MLETRAGHVHRFNLLVGDQLLMCRCRATRHLCSRCEARPERARGMCKVCLNAEYRAAKKRTAA